MNKAVTKPGELWHHLGPTSNVVSLAREGALVPVAIFVTERDAACAVQGHNILMEIAALHRRPMKQRERDTAVMNALSRYGL